MMSPILSQPLLCARAIDKAIEGLQSLPSSNLSSTDDSKVFLPDDSNEDKLLSKVHAEKKLDENFRLHPEEARELPMLNGERINLLIEDTLEELTFELPSPINQLKVPIREVLTVLQNECKKRGIPFQGIEMVGSGASYFAGPELYQTVLNEIIQDDHVGVTKHMLAEIREKPVDVDYRFFVYGSTASALGYLKEALIHCLMAKLPPGLTLEEKEDLIKSKKIDGSPGYIFSELDEILVPDPEKKMEKLHYCSLGFENTNPPKRDILLVRCMDRRVVFTVQDFRLPLVVNSPYNSGENISYAIRPVGDIACGRQAILDKLTKVLHIHEPEQVHYKAWGVLHGFIAKGYKYPTTRGLEVLREKILAKCNGSIQPIYKLFEKWQKEHKALGPNRFTAYVFNACQDLYGHVGPEFIESLWNQTKPLFSAADSIWKSIIDTLDDPQVPFELVSAIIQLRGFIELSLPVARADQSADFFLTKHEGKPAIQIGTAQSYLLVSFDLSQALSVVLKHVDFLAHKDNHRPRKLVQKLFGSFQPLYRPQYIIPSLTKYKENLSIDYTHLEIGAQKIMKMPRGLRIAYRLWMACHQLNPSRSTLYALCKLGPKALLAESSKMHTRFLWTALEQLLVDTFRKGPWAQETFYIPSLSPINENNERINELALVFKWAMSLVKTRNPVCAAAASDLWFEYLDKWTCENTQKSKFSFFDDLLSRHPALAIDRFLALQQMPGFPFAEEQRLLNACIQAFTAEKRDLLLASGIKLAELTTGAQIHWQKYRQQQPDQINESLAALYAKLLLHLFNCKESQLGFRLFKTMMAEKELPIEWQAPALWNACIEASLSDPSLGLSQAVRLWQQGAAAGIFSAEDDSLMGQQVRVALLDAMQKEGFEGLNDYLDRFETGLADESMRMRLSQIMFNLLSDLENEPSKKLPFSSRVFRVVKRIFYQDLLQTPELQEAVKTHILRMTSFHEELEISPKKFLQILELAEHYQRVCADGSAAAIAYACLKILSKHCESYPDDLISRGLLLALQSLGAVKKPSAEAKESLYELSLCCTVLLRKKAKKDSVVFVQVKEKLAAFANHLVQALWLKQNDTALLHLLKILGRLEQGPTFSKASTAAIFQGFLASFDNKIVNSFENFLKKKLVVEEILYTKKYLALQPEEEKQLFICMAKSLIAHGSISAALEKDWIECLLFIFNGLSANEPSLLVDYLKNDPFDLASYTSFQRSAAYAALIMQDKTANQSEDLLQQTVDLWNKKSAETYIEKHPIVHDAYCKLLNLLFSSANSPEGFRLLEKVFSQMSDQKISPQIVKIAAEAISEEGKKSIIDKEADVKHLFQLAEKIRMNIWQIPDIHLLLMALMRHTNTTVKALSFQLLRQILADKPAKNSLQMDSKQALGKVFSEMILNGIHSGDWNLFVLAKGLLKHPKIQRYIHGEDQSRLWMQAIQVALQRGASSCTEEGIKMSLAFFKEHIKGVKKNSEEEWECIDKVLDNLILLYTRHKSAASFRTWMVFFCGTPSLNGEFVFTDFLLDKPNVRKEGRRLCRANMMLIEKLADCKGLEGESAEYIDAQIFDRLGFFIATLPDVMKDYVNVLDKAIYNPHFTDINDDGNHLISCLEFIAKSSVQKYLEWFPLQHAGYAIFLQTQECPPGVSQEEFRKTMADTIVRLVEQKTSTRYLMGVMLLNKLTGLRDFPTEVELKTSLCAIFKGLPDVALEYYKGNVTLLEKIQYILLNKSRILLSIEKVGWQNSQTKAFVWLSYIETLILLVQIYPENLFTGKLSPIENLPGLLEMGWKQFAFHQKNKLFERYISAVINLFPLLESRVDKEKKVKFIWKIPELLSYDEQKLSEKSRHARAYGMLLWMRHLVKSPDLPGIDWKIIAKKQFEDAEAEGIFAGFPKIKGKVIQCLNIYFPSFY